MMDETESLRDQLFIANWEASRKFREHYRWSKAATRTDTTLVHFEHGGNYDPYTPDEWHRMIGDMLLGVSILDTPANREMYRDFDSIHWLCSQLANVCLNGFTPCNPFYLHGHTRRYEVRQHDNGYYEVISSQAYDGTF